MITFKSPLLVSLFAVFSLGAGVAQAQMNMDHNKMGEMKMDKPAADTAMTDGEVRKIDKTQNKITLRHGDIKNLGMPGMTMVFGVNDPKMLDNLKEGDKVKFTADKMNGAIVVTKIEAVK